MQTYFMEQRSTRRDRLSTSETAGRDRHHGAVETQPTHAQGALTYAHGSRRFAAVASRHQGLCAAAFLLALGVCSSAQAQGQVYDFSSGAGTTNTAFKGGGSTLPPATNTVPTGVFVAADYTAVATSDDSWQTSGGTATKALTRFVFTVSEDSATLLDLTIDWEGNTSTGGTVKLFLWNNTAGSYTDTLQSTTSITDATLTFTTLTPTDFIDADDKVTVLVANTAGSKFINTDYVKITVRQCATNADCDDSNVCTDDACVSGLCQNNNDDTNSCSDGNACTQTDTCQSGTCTGSDLVVCTPLDVCRNAGTCNTGTGQCSNPRKAEGAPCGVAGTECEVQDTCTAFGFCTDNGFKSAATPCTGVSQGGDCDDDPADHCTGTSNVCEDAVTTSCINSDGCCPLGCDVSNDTDCVGCTQNSDCNDDDVCNGAETCSGGFCRQGTTLNCNDDDRCTTDTCDPDAGCHHENLCGGKLQRQQHQR